MLSFNSRIVVVAYFLKFKQIDPYCPFKQKQKCFLCFIRSETYLGGESLAALVFLLHVRFDRPGVALVSVEIAMMQASKLHN